MKKRLLFALPILIPTLAMACFPSPQRFSDDDDEDSSGDFDFTTGTTSGAGGATAGGAGGATQTAASTTNASTTSGSGPSAISAATSTSGSTSSGMGNGVCNSGLTTGSDGYDTCLSASCCVAFDNCIANTACNDCMVGTGTSCETNSLFQSFEICSDQNCPVDICGTGIAMSDGNDPAFACNDCGSANCCDSATTCVQGGSQAEVTTCIDCLNEDPNCTSAPSEVQTSATEFNTCLESSCAGVCGL